jgi:hypothetical protein
LLQERKKFFSSSAVPLVSRKALFVLGSIPVRGTAHLLAKFSLGLNTPACHVLDELDELDELDDDSGG